MVTAKEVREKYLAFFKERDHVVIPSASLIPDGDSTTLFTGSGMQPLLPYLLGKEHPGGSRVVDSQKSFRAEDIEEVGDNRHTTFFEMLGNWSFGDYFKKEQLRWFFEFLTEEIGLDPERIYVTVFSGDEKYGIPKDTEAAAIWKELFQEKGIDAKEADIITEEAGGERGVNPGERIFYYDAKKNWWSRSGTPENMPAREPGGPDSEVFYEFTDVEHDKSFGAHCHPNCDCGRFMEIGNSVFMQYKKVEGDTFEKLAQFNVDFGGGLERIVAAANNAADMFTIDLFSDTMSFLESYIPETEGRRVVADHIRSSIFLIADGVRPSNKEQGYVLRRLMRRLLVKGYRHELREFDWLEKVIRMNIAKYDTAYPELTEAAEEILEVFRMEMKKFFTTLENGLKVMEGLKGKETISGKDAFDLFATHGFPIELTREIAKEENIEIDVAGFEAELEKHKEISKAGAEKKFGGHGLILNTGELKAKDEEELKKVTRLHTATHLLQAALRHVLGDEVKQAGSDITVERTRFDFTFPRKLTDEEKEAVEAFVNKAINDELPMQYVEMKKEEAEKTGALYFFKERYPEMVKVYYAGKTLEDAVTKEFCGGPHVNNTKEIGEFKIKKEKSIGSGIRRIRGIVLP